MRASIDTGKCRGHGQCYSLAPEMYEDDADGFGTVLNDGDVPADLEGAAERGAANCPEKAITISR